MIIDLDELVLMCRGKAARSYISEAVACYKVQAYRSAIIATWIAVLFDFIHKLRELEMTGDKAARQKLADFDDARKSQDVRASLDFERSLVTSARDEFQFISAVEAVDLQRLFDDRNRSAHSSMISTDEPYTPSAELARTHIHAAVTILLSHPPVQGQAALEQIWADVRSEFFPRTAEEALKFLKEGPLGRARTPVVRSVIIGVTKDLVNERRGQSESERQIAALNATLQLYPDIARETLSEKLLAITNAVVDGTFDLVIRYLSNIRNTWKYIGVSAQLRAINYVQKGPAATANRYIPHALGIPELRSYALGRIEEVDGDVFAVLIRNRQDPAFVPRAISLWASSGGFRTAEARLEQLLIPLAPLFTEADIKKIAHAFRSNDQILYASGTAAGLLSILEASRELELAKTAWKEIYDVTVTHEYYSESRGPDLNKALETRFGFTPPK